MGNQINHVAIIMDGNGRWAKKRGLPRTKGHEEGCKRIIEIFDAVKANHIYCMTLYAFSTENWNRPKSEITLLFQYLDKYKNGVSQTAITISIIVVVVAIDIITGKLNIPINASVLKK